MRFQCRIDVIHWVEVNLSSLHSTVLIWDQWTYLWIDKVLRNGCTVYDDSAHMGFSEAFTSQQQCRWFFTARLHPACEALLYNVCQLIDTTSQRLAFLRSAALLFPRGAQMLALLSPASPSFRPGNICTAVLSAATHGQERTNPFLNCWQQGAGRHRWQEGVSGDWHQAGGGQVEARTPIWSQCWHTAPGHPHHLLGRKPVRSWKSPCAKRCTLWAVSMALRRVPRGRGGSNPAVWANFSRQWREKNGS